MPSETTVATTGKMAEPSIVDANEPVGDADRPAVASSARASRKTAAEKPATAGKSPRKRSERKAGAAERPTRKGRNRSAATVSADTDADRTPAPVDPGDAPPSSGDLQSEPAPVESRKSTRKSASTRSSRQSKKEGTATQSGKASTARKSKQAAGGKSGAPKSAGKTSGKSRTSRKAPPAAPAPAAPPELPDGYVPNGEEEYMGPMQAEYFRRKLIDWRQALLDESEQTLESMRDQQREVSDEAERASRETEMSFELRTRDRYRKLIRKINEALIRIEDGSYGFCEETGDPIGLGRLEARPIATLSVEAQERREMLERQYRP